MGGSDAHLARAVGHVRTHFPGRTAADLRLAMERGQTWTAFDWKTHLKVALPMLRWMAMGPLRGRTRRRTRMPVRF